VWTRARARAQAALGTRYDIKDFHEAGLGCGRVPLDVLDGVIDGFIAGKRPKLRRNAHPHRPHR
jgi:uncharacterized protein (DUF885 family)